MEHSERPFAYAVDWIFVRVVGEKFILVFRHFVIVHYHEMKLLSCITTLSLYHARINIWPNCFLCRPRKMIVSSVSAEILPNDFLGIMNLFTN